MSSKFFKTAMVSATVAFAGFSSTSANAATSQADAFATILTAVTLTNPVDMNFGYIVADATGGNVTLTQAGARNCGTLICGGSFNEASFTVGAVSGQVVDINVPASVNLSNGTDTMPLAFNAPASINSTGSDIIGIGGTLTVAPNQPVGLYQANFTVTADYN